MIKTIYKKDLRPIMRDIGIRLREKEKIEGIREEGFYYVGDNTFINNEVRIKGRYRGYIEDLVEGKVLDYIICDGVQIEDYREDYYRELRAYIKVKIITDKQIIWEWINILSEEIR